MRSKIKYGFSLLEVSIVLVVIGLCVGGVVAGRHLIRANDLQAATSEAQMYVAAIKNFKDKYLSIPGDMPNATAVWGPLNAIHATCIITASSDKRTCNGNGNGMINDNYEMYRFWQHLSNAILISGSFSGVQGPANTWDHEFGTNAPLSVFPGAGYGINYVDQAAATNIPQYFAGHYGHTLFLGNDSNGMPGQGLSATEVAAFDRKSDDGRPGTGNIRTLKSTAPWGAGCSTTDDAGTALYTSNNTLCHTLIITGQ